MEPINSAIQQLDAADKLSEEAIVEILNLLGELQTVVSTLTDAAAQAQCNATIARLYEICTFQDLASQHLTRAENALHEVVKVGVAPAGSPLLRGPALAGEASASQADADRLLSGN